MITLKQSVIVAAIGEPLVGKTTALEFLAEIFFEDGVNHAEVINIKNVMPMDIDRLVVRTRYARGIIAGEPFKQLILADNLDSVDQVKHLRQYYDAVVVRVSRADYDGGNIVNSFGYVNHWSYSAPADVTVRNDGTLRLFKFQLRDLYINNIVTLNKLKDRIAYDNH